MVTKADNSRGQVFFVDDELAVCTAVRETLEESNISVRCFTHPAECLAQLRSQRCDLLITDLKMPEENGMQLLEEVKELTPWIPVLIVTGYGDIPTAVKAIKCGGIDFIEKPLGKDGFVRKVNSLLEQSRRLPLDGFWALTRMEIQVLKLVVAGRSNSEIAAVIKRSIRTVESHRAAFMQKLGVRTVIEFLKLAAATGLIASSTRHEENSPGR
ncbi:MAG: response regulator transcription factor [Phycisphaerales bacterium]|nr:MAG: response regulator transcription factor [Phycisphaerales bacterium]